MTGDPGNPQGNECHIEKCDDSPDGCSRVGLSLLCSDTRDLAIRGIMRMYIQVPYINTELGDAKTRSRQKRPTFIPKELKVF